jgi:two-component system cell cycle response regulator CtrA
MRMYVFEQRQDRHSGLSKELRTAGVEAIFVTDEFFVTGIGQLLQQGHETNAILIAESEDMRRQIQVTRAAGCVNPIIVIRDFRNAQDTSELLNIGADDVIVSPIKGTELLSRTNSIIRRLYGHAGESVIVGELTAYFDGRDPIVSGSQIKLSKREYSVFQHLALNSNRVISKDAIYDAIYGTSIDQPFDKVIDVYICKLRKKFATASESGWQYIETVHGRGYKLSSPQPQSQIAS